MKGDTVNYVQHTKQPTSPRNKLYLVKHIENLHLLMKPILASIVGINPLSKPTLRKHPLLEPIHHYPRG
jgi:hypothetical protein